MRLTREDTRSSIRSTETFLQKDARTDMNTDKSIITERLSLGPIHESDQDALISIFKHEVVSATYMVPDIRSSEDEKKIFTDRLICHSLNFMAIAPGDYVSLEGEGKVRYAAKPERARAYICGDRAEICFERPVRAVTPGQSVVFYDGDKILFGGMIER